MIHCRFQMIEITYNKNLKHLNTFGLKIVCDRYVEYDTEDDLIALMSENSVVHQGPWMHIGGGSNLLFEGDYHGTVLHSRLKGIDIVGEHPDGTVTVEVGAATPFDEFVKWSVGKSLWGAENLSLIPGETGGAAVQNIGAYGVELKDIVEEIRCVDALVGGCVTIRGCDAGYGYRDSMFKQPDGKRRFLVSAVRFRLSRQGCPRLDYGNLSEAVDSELADSGLRTPLPATVRTAVIRIRRMKLPDVSEIGSAGSFFKNPVVDERQYNYIKNQLKRRYGYHVDVPAYRVETGKVKLSAAWLIDMSGGKGLRVGGATVWDSQPLVIVNADGRATPDDILCLEQFIVDGVRERFSVTLEPEVEHICVNEVSSETKKRK